jgi:hypothetical protein
VRPLGNAIIQAMMFVTLIACGADPAAKRPATTPSPDATAGEAKHTGTSSPDQEVFFTEHHSLAVPLAMGGGRLRLDDEGCIRMTIPGEGPESGRVPVWPSNFELDAGAGRCGSWTGGVAGWWRRSVRG